MNIVLFTTPIRVALAVAAVLLIAATIIAVKRGRGGLGALLGVAALLSGRRARGRGAGRADRPARRARRPPTSTSTAGCSSRRGAGSASRSAPPRSPASSRWPGARPGAPNAWRRATMIGLRAGAAVTALVMFLEPAVELRQVAREPNRIAVLIDDSKSMALSEDPKGPSRIERARQLLADSGETLASWEHTHKIDYYTFAETVNATTRAGLASDTAQGKATLIRKALEYIRGHYEGRDLAGIVLISDGASTGGFDEDSGDGAVARLPALARYPGPHGVGRPPRPARRRGRQGHGRRVRVRAHRRAGRRGDPHHGLPARQVPVTLSTDGQPLRQKLVDLPAGEHDVRVTSRSRRRGSAATSTRCRCRSHPTRR